MESTQAAESKSWTAVRDWLQSPVDIAILAYFRVAFGAIMLWEMWRYASYGWISRYWIEPSFHFTYFGFNWIRPWPGSGMYVHFAVMALLAFFVLLGLWYRLSAVLFFLGFSYIFLLEQAHYLNHFYLICLIAFIMIFLPANRAWAVDAWRKPDGRADWMPNWCLWLLLDLLVVPFLLWRKTRPFAFAAAVLFHLMNAHLFSIGIFPWFMIAATAVFFHPGWPRRALSLFGLEQRKAAAPAKIKLPDWGMALLGIYVLLQVMLPLRKMSTRPYLILQYAHFLAKEAAAQGHGEVAVQAEVWASLNGRPPQQLINPNVNLAAQPRTPWPVDWILPLTTPLVVENP